MAEVIFYNGTIVPVTEPWSEAEALAVTGGRIHCVGTQETVMRLRADDTRLVDLGGKTLLPGLIEPHTHPISTAAKEHMYVDITGFTPLTAEEAWGRVSRAAASTPPGQWIRVNGYNPMLIPGIQAPTTQLLDGISTNHPIYVMSQNGHAHYVNSLALKIAGIDENTPQPKMGKIVKDDQGHLTGQLSERASELMNNHVPRLDPGVSRTAVRRQLEDYARKGFTTITAMGLFAEFKGSFKSLRQVCEGVDSPVRLVLYHRDKNMAGMTSPGQINQDQYCHIGVKWWSDGSPYAGTMATAEPYLDTALTREGLCFPEAPCKGHLLYTNQELYNSMLPYHEAGCWQLATHAQGERAIEQTLDVYDALLRHKPREDHRYRIEHCGLITESQLQRAQSLGVSLSFFPDHIHYFGRHLRDDILGAERAERFMPLGSAIRAAHRPTVHADSPCTPPSPFRTMRAAVTRAVRRDRDLISMTSRDDAARPASSRESSDATGSESEASDIIIGQSQAIPAREALKAMTINAAWQIFHEKSLGSFEKGKLADFILVSENPTTIDPYELDTIEVIRTYRSGREVVFPKSDI